MWSICHSLPQWMKLAQAPSHDLTFVTRYLTINYKWSQVIMWTRFTWWCLCVHILCALKFKNEPPHFSCVKRSVNPIYYGVCGENFWDTSHNICWKSPESDFACLENIFSKVNISRAMSSSSIHSEHSNYHPAVITLLSQEQQRGQLDRGTFFLSLFFSALAWCTRWDRVRNAESFFSLICS